MHVQQFQLSDEQLTSVSDLAEARLNQVIKPEISVWIGGNVFFRNWQRTEV